MFADVVVVPRGLGGKGFRRFTLAPLSSQNSHAKGKSKAKRYDFKFFSFPHDDVNIYNVKQTRKKFIVLHRLMSTTQ